MSRNENQKLKLIYILKILMEKTDDEHGVTSKDIINELEKYDIKAERKSIYTDIDALNRFGFEIEGHKEGKKYEYKLISGRKYQLPEVKLLVDAVQSSRFITHRKTDELIRKLEKEVSIYDAKKLHRTVCIDKRSKSDNESILITIDGIYTAMQCHSQISFKYYEWVVNFNNYNKVEEVPKRNGKIYQVSPWSMFWNDEKYYLVAYDTNDKIIKHFRVDRIKFLRVLSDYREGMEEFKNFDVSTYVKSTFKMFGGGHFEKVTLRIDNSIIGVIIDRFGNDYEIVKYNDYNSDVTISVYLSQQFFGWLFGLGEKVEIISPVNVRQEYIKSIQNVFKKYQ